MPCPLGLQQCLNAFLDSFWPFWFSVCNNMNSVARHTRLIHSKTMKTCLVVRVVLSESAVKPGQAMHRAVPLSRSMPSWSTTTLHIICYLFKDSHDVSVEWMLDYKGRSHNSSRADGAESAQWVKAFLHLVVLVKLHCFSDMLTAGFACKALWI